MTKTFYSNGKLLITGEYVVLNGAVALALPTKFGQSLQVSSFEKNKIKWSSYDADESCWFDTIFTFDEIKIKEKKDENCKIKNTLIEILHHSFLLNPHFLKQENGYQIKTYLTFPRNWGLGTSSTLINNIANWLSIDAHVLLKNSFGGSGYDLACAKYNGAILYQLIDEKPLVQLLDYQPSFTDNIYFVYLNKKQNSKTAIANYFNRLDNMIQNVETISKLTYKITASKTVDDFMNLLQKHEREMSSIIEQQTIQEVLFSDFDGVVKSLGAWGGDFVMVVSKKDPKEYFRKKGFSILLTYDEMIL